MEYLNVKDLSFKYNEKLVFDNVSFNIKNGEFVCVIGSNSSGKTTLLNLINNINNTDSVSISGLINCKVKVSLIDFNIDLYSKTLLDELFAQTNYCKKNTISLLKDFNLYKFLEKSPQDLTYFEILKLKFIKCIMNDSKIILIDSVFSLLNMYEKIEFISIIKKYQIKFKFTIIYATVNYDDIIFCDKLLIINNKKIISEKVEYVYKSKYAKESNINIPLFYELYDKLKLYDLISDNIATIDEMVEELCS